MFLALCVFPRTLRFFPKVNDERSNWRASVLESQSSCATPGFIDADDVDLGASEPKRASSLPPKSQYVPLVEKQRMVCKAMWTISPNKCRQGSPWICVAHPIQISAPIWALQVPLQRRPQHLSTLRRKLRTLKPWLLREVWVIQRFAAGSASISLRAIVPMEMPAPTATCLIHKSLQSLTRGSAPLCKLWIIRSWSLWFYAWAEPKLRNLASWWKPRISLRFC